MEGDDLGMIQEHYICCALYSYDYINSTSDHQVGDLCPKMFWELNEVRDVDSIGTSPADSLRPPKTSIA